MRKLWIALAITCGVLFIGGVGWGSYSYYRLGKSRSIWNRPRYGSRYGYSRYRRPSYGDRFASLIGASFIRRWKTRVTVGFSVGGSALLLGALFIVLAARGKRSQSGAAMSYVAQQQPPGVGASPLGMPHTPPPPMAPMAMAPGAPLRPPLQRPQQQR